MECNTMPYCICPATRSISLVQHAPGFSPTEAPFMFVGQRQNVKRIVAVPWQEAFNLAESLPEAKDMGPVLLIQMTGRCGSTVLAKALERSKLAAASGQGARKNAHLPEHRAKIVRELMRDHALLQRRG